MTAGNEDKDEALDLLLPWYVNGTLAGEELRQVEAYLARSSHARDEVALLRELRQQVKDETREAGPGELGLQRLKRQIKQDAGRAGQSARRTAAVAGFWRPLAVAACLAVVVQAGVMIGLTGGPGSEVDIAGGSADLGAPMLQVTFAPDATEMEMRDVLQAAGASIADGPNTLGVYRLRLVDAGSTTVEEALATLRANADVVTFAERN